MKKPLMFILVISMFSSLVSAKVFINEVEFNPAGSDTGNEWVELYNDGLSAVNISDWEIIDNSGNTLIGGGSIINATRFFVINSSHTITNTNQNFTLLNDTNGIVDFTIRFNDSSPTAGDNKAWARVPDGSNVWQFQNETKAANNLDLVSPNITSQKRHPNPVFEDDNVYLNATIDENYLKEVRINGTWEGNWNIFTVFSATNNVTERNFTYVVSEDDLESGEFIEWYYIAEDNSGNIGIGEKQNFTIRLATLVNITPSSPDGLNGYYVTIPIFTFLLDAQAISTYYRFDSLQWNLFVGPFLFDINGTLGGIERMDFFSNFGSRNESIYNITIKVDVFGPELISINPTGIIRSGNVNINALIDDKYQSNSGLNLGSLVMKVDNIVVNPNLTSLDSLKARVNYSTSGLAEGNHSTNISIYDNAGNLGGGNWNFFVNLTTHILTVNSPASGNYGSNRVRFDINANIPGKITFKDNDNEQVLCNTCVTINKTLSLRDGYHNLTINVGNEEVNRSIFIDSKEPKIIKIMPKSKTYVNGTELSVKYTEDFLDNINILYGNGSLMFSTNLSNCESGRNVVCAIDIDLSNFNGQAINFSFNVSDSIRSINSKINTLFVDTTKPLIIINFPNNISQTRRVNFDLSVSEVVRGLSYIDFSDIRPSEKRLCRNCQYYNKTRSFNNGNHSLKFIVEDKAGNMGEANVNFTVM
ncbi:lamin tail domain-containing protein [Candidatus Woesearchaeota archaeon]|nr:lamin tail domain-containing protein [Candidatus Woesearchaeota archaeon]